jgi:hypothetical protein
MRPRLGYLVAGMLALSADFFPRSWRTMHALHDAIHYQTDWGTLLYRKFVGVPVPTSWRIQSANPYFLTGWGLELFVEGCVFFAALWILSRGAVAESKQEVLHPGVSSVSSDTKAVVS